MKQVTFLIILLLSILSHAQEPIDTVSLRETYYKKVYTRSIIKGAIYGGIVGAPLGEFSTDNANLTYAAVAAISLYPATQIIINGTRKRVARKLGISPELAAKWDDEYFTWKRKKREAKRKGGG